MMHACPVAGCPVDGLKGHRILCPEHFGLVPLPLQRTLIRLYCHGRTVEGFAEARANAIEQVEEKLRRRRPC